MRYLRKFNENSSLVLFLLDFGMLITMNLAKCESLAKDDISRKELSYMLNSINKPIINGLKYTEILNKSEMIRSSKILDGLLIQVDNFIKFIEPRIINFIKDSDTKSNWLKKIEDMKSRLSIIKNNK